MGNYVIKFCAGLLANIISGLILIDHDYSIKELTVNSEKKTSGIRWNLLIWFFPVLFLIDNILGFNGYQFTIAGKSIRIILFCITAAVLCVYSLFVCHRDGISLLPWKKGTVSIFSLLKPIDYIVLLFIVGNALWATVVPLIQRGEMQYALKDFSTILVMTLYFPLVFLIRTGRLNLDHLEKLTYILCIILAIWHCVMYIGDTIHPGFYASYYDFIDMISSGTAVRSDVIYGFGITRVIQTTSLFLLLGAFIAIRYCLRGKHMHFMSVVLFVFAICVTYTKSIWFGFIFGSVVYLVPVLFSKQNKKLRKCALLVGISILLTVTTLNYTVFDNTIFTRVLNIGSTQVTIESLEDELDKLIDTTEGEEEFSEEEIEKLQNEILDAKGTQLSNSIRAKQNSALIKKWKQKAWFGFGYGSYTEECIRNEQYPYMYETTLLALMMKLGIVGALVWVVFIVSAVVSSAGFFWKRNRSDLFWWLGLAISYGLAVQTNPFLFTFTGFSILLYLMLAIQEKNGCRS